MARFMEFKMLMLKLGIRAVAGIILFSSLGCLPKDRMMIAVKDKMAVEDDEASNEGPGIIAVKDTHYDGLGESCQIRATERFKVVSAKQLNKERVAVTLVHEIPGCSVGKNIEVNLADVAIENIEIDGLTSNPSKKPESIETGTGFETADNFRFPIKYIPESRYTDEGRGFGAKRSNGRLHAANDLLGKGGNEILAVGDGVIKDYYEFYCGSFAIVVDHGSFLVRYGEVSMMAKDLKVGGHVKKGQVIGKMGVLCGLSSMLHFEKYKGTAKGELTDRNNPPFQRRSDLVNPTSFLKATEWTVASKS
jgi:murein DD-endopeptidase MepM/ murein hydrolase activator NlpD